MVRRPIFSRLTGIILLILSLACNLPALGGSRFSSPGGEVHSSPVPFPTAFSGGSAGAIGAAPLPGAGNQPGQPFAGLTQAVPGNVPPLRSADPPGSLLQYLTQPGDTLAALSLRFAVQLPGSSLPAGTSPEALLPAGIPLTLPSPSVETLPALALLPDSEVIYGPPAAAFDLQAFINASGGYLSTFRETIDGEEMSGAQIVRRIALETSINPRLLLAVLEWRSGWVTGSPRNPDPDYPIGFGAPSHRGLYRELALVTRLLTQAYYGWRSGTFSKIEFLDGTTLPPHPALNAGSVAVQNLTARLNSPVDWPTAVYGENGLLAVYDALFGDPWKRAAQYEPLFPPDLSQTQPHWELPFAPGEVWSFTGGPHMAWGIGSPAGALDFAPADEAKGCTPSVRWATAAADGVVVRSERGLLVLDVDGDGYEQTGWSLLYLHLANEGRLSVGTRVKQGEPLGHPSCEGGPATGRHVHIVRKYHGEWIGAGAILPFILSGWLVKAGELPYQGQLLKEGQVIEARPDGSAPARIVR
ncbi:membrane proteins related to metalloendopeptidases [Anaerolinea thermolimosa]|uniref:Membrane proteins related to metalloendopeptidases n=1 Tax=Anaerolinea thermolimosa TaxID=229919 RepID=A0A7U9KM63_9CHLR|nr:M23 family metallopeptidase [Anaerolinea thermolimosa]GAP08331.1 membrane proteins related to metalloendopeptidases [Anaerolinea thermolimosa]